MKDILLFGANRNSATDLPITEQSVNEKLDKGLPLTSEEMIFYKPILQLKTKLYIENSEKRRKNKQ